MDTEKRTAKKTLGSNTKTVKRVIEMEAILDKAEEKIGALEKAIAEYEACQADIGKLEAYYTSAAWKKDLAYDEAGRFPADLKRGVLSEDGIYDLLERNKDLLERGMDGN